MAMERKEAVSSSPTYGRFHTTHWTVILQARDQVGGGAQEALERLCRVYWRPLYAFIRRQGHTPHEAEDLTQEFFRRFLEREALASVDPAEGRFRSFLLACLKNFLANERERAGAKRRGGGQSIVSFDLLEAESSLAAGVGEDLAPDAEYERRWAFAVLARAIELMRAEFVAEARGDFFKDLEGFLPGGVGNLSRADVASRRGMTVGALDVAIHRLRHRFGAKLRELISQTVASEAEIELELRHLISVLGR